jgi:hypothetical protein
LLGFSGAGAENPCLFKGKMNHAPPRSPIAAINETGRNDMMAKSRSFSLYSSYWLASLQKMSLKEQLINLQREGAD